MRGLTADITGERFGRLVVLERAGTNDRGASLWRCRCDCGNEKVTRGFVLRQGRCRSCGCLQDEQRRAKRKTDVGSESTEYNTWEGMKARCLNPDSEAYADYGGRGIAVCARWLSFENFLADMGKRPNGRSLDRIDNNGNYEPGNCRWATRREQANNKRSNHLVSINGRSMSLMSSCRELGLSYIVTRRRLELFGIFALWGHGERTGLNGDKTHCKRGHAFTEENTVRRGGYRKCRECARGYRRAARAARRRADEATP